MMLAKALASASASAPKLYIEDVMASWLYTGNGSTQTITNGIDLSGKGGLVWTKLRATGGSGNYTGNLLFDTVRGSTKNLKSDSTAAEATYSSGYGLNSFNANGFTVKDISDLGYGVNESSATYASWTFRKAAKFFDVVTYAGSNSTQTINHNLGSVPGFIIVKNITDGTVGWYCYHTSLGNAAHIILNQTTSANTSSGLWASTSPTSTQFTVVGNNLTVNQSGSNYVAYLFAHDAGGFGDSGNDNVVSCGSFTTDGSGNATVNLGWEPQWLMVKNTTSAQNWYVEDSMRGFNLTSRAILFPNLSNAEATGTTAYLAPSSTGFSAVNGQLDTSSTYIYIAIRRGPMKTPTVGTEVFNAVARTGTNAAATVTAGFTVDLGIVARRDAAYTNTTDRLRGATRYLLTSSTSAEVTSSDTVIGFDSNSAIRLGTDLSTGYFNDGVAYINYLFRRAPGFFDVVAYTGTGANRTVSHNLGVAPQLIITKRRSGVSSWWTYAESLGNTKGIYLDLDSIPVTSSLLWNDTSPTSTVFTVGSGATNVSSSTYIAYLFATCPGVSKVGNYTGNGTTLNIDCGFTAGSRFVLIKRTDSTGNWLVADTARGIVSGNDPLLYLNSTAAEITTLDWLDPDSSGFIVNQEATANANVNGATYIYLSVA